MENTEENREKVARAIVDAMELEDIIEELVWRLSSEYKGSPELFLDDYETIKEDLLAGEE